ncbi:hypothetical protein ABBQ38_001396 [Trebouxia sp. C0009 RCD-2024]
MHVRMKKAFVLIHAFQELRTDLKTAALQFLHAEGYATVGTLNLEGFSVSTYTKVGGWGDPLFLVVAKVSGRCAPRRSRRLQEPSVQRWHLKTYSVGGLSSFQSFHSPFLVNS